MTPFEKKCKVKAVNDIINDEGNLVGLGHVTPNNVDAKPLKNAKEKEIIESLSPQVSICEEDGPILTEGRNTITLTIFNFDRSLGTILDDILPFFDGDCREAKVMDIHTRIGGSDSDYFVLGILTYCQNDGSYLYLLTPILSPLSTDTRNLISSQSSLLDHCEKTQSFFPDDSNNDMPESDLSQISGPHGKSKPTPLSQSGLQDPTRVGGGQQLTWLKYRGDLKPDPRFDAINVIALGLLLFRMIRIPFLNFMCFCVVKLKLLRGAGVASVWTLDGISGCKMLVFFEEKYLLSHFMKIVCSSDPDIIMGWDIQGGFLYFLAEKASVSTFGGNLGLCDSPLSKNCGYIEPPTYETRQESLIVEGFDWKVVVIGYACGLIIGLVIGYFAISRRTN
ncbi:hypothetical protein CMV_026372 [Castanea mollissima]|uniref:DNA-directed DNA polymerase family B exonuclease domain-containing protein n=1 Tax=Castanea mollissima TaxID=60419 RepID=A0A8J4V3X3_9ROSI|nr:hypothetical protein CMV_026372 [Castanea mollissima]